MPAVTALPLPLTRSRTRRALGPSENGAGGQRAGSDIPALTCPPISCVALLSHLISVGAAAFLPVKAGVGLMIPESLSAP